MSNTTSINDLPTDPTGGGSIEGNINLVTNEISLPSQESSTNQSINLDQTTINQIISGLQQASTTGLTSLPSRDIPRSSEQITQDPYIQPNFIPASSRDDYLHEDDTNENIINNYERQQKTQDSLDALYNEIQIPLLLAVIYFAFQLPIFKNTLFKYIPAIYNKDANYNLSGYFFTSVLFGLTYYFLSKIIFQVSQL